MCVRDGALYDPALGRVAFRARTARPRIRSRLGLVTPCACGADQRDARFGQPALKEPLWALETLPKVSRARAFTRYVRPATVGTSVNRHDGRASPPHTTAWFQVTDVVHVAARAFQYLPVVGSCTWTSTCRTSLSSAAVPRSRSGAVDGGELMAIVGFTVSGEGRALHPNRCTRAPS